MRAGLILLGGEKNAGRGRAAARLSDDSFCARGEKRDTERMELRLLK